MVQRNYIHDAPVNDVVIHPNQGELISCDQSGSVKIWDLGENTCTHELVPDEEVAIRSVSIASDGGMLVAGNDLVSHRQMRLANVDEGSELNSRVWCMYGGYNKAPRQRHYTPSRLSKPTASTSRDASSRQIQSESTLLPCYTQLTADISRLARRTQR